MQFLTKLLLAGVVAIGVGATVAPSEAAAQCTMRCECDENACGCSRNDGNGSACYASGDGCYVYRCQPKMAASLDRAIFARDGKALAPIAGIDADGRAGAVPTTGVSWEVLPSGIAVARNCAGIVVQRYVSKARATALREKTRVLATQD